MMKYDLQRDYEMIAKHCPRCDALVMAAVIRTSRGEVYKYREVKCSRCDWENVAASSSST